MRFKKTAIATMAIAITLGIGYYLAVFTEVPYISNMRTLWIETAMTTADHQWLATSFIPASVVDKVMQKSNKIEDIVSITGIKSSSKTAKYSNTYTNKESINTNKTANKTVNMQQAVDILNQRNLGSTDEFGNKILVNDKEQGLVIIEIKSLTFAGKMVMIDDPSRVIVGQTAKRGVQGELILDYLKDFNAVVGINANGFDDAEGSGSGGDILGCSLSGGMVWGNTSKKLNTTIGLDDQNRLVVGDIDDWSKYKLRDAAQFKPVLIANGKIITVGSDGWGINPRTVVGQRADGVIVFMVIDGRQPGHSIGITVGEAAEILFKYGVINAAACDGGSSSVLAYNGKIINKPSTPLDSGRYLPNAFLVRKKWS